MRSGFVPVVGRPNVGKSTLVNALVGSKVAITSSRPQTTRNTIRGVLTKSAGETASWQIVFVDTPGLHKPKTQLGNRLNSLVYGTLAEADAVVFLIDATQPIGPGDRLIAQRLKDANADVILAVNKTDKASKREVVGQLAEAAEWDFAGYVPVSALEAENLDALVEELVARLPEGPMYYPPDTTGDQPDHVLAGEIIREKFLEKLMEELPHSLVIVVDDMTVREDGLLAIGARAIVERNSQKGIVIGKGGSMLKQAGSEAREELEVLFGTKVFLEMRVTVEPDWQRRPSSLDRLGFGV